MSRPAASRGAVVLLALLLASCGSGPTSTRPTVSSSGPVESAGGPSRTGGSPPAATTGASPAARSPRPTGSPPVATIPGFEDWTILNPTSVAASSDGETLVLALTRRALWFQSQRGVLVWKPVAGDFRVTATVSVVRTSDPAAPLDEGGSVRLAGLMARADAARENYVFVVVGADQDGLSVETKSTRDNDSRFDGPAWPTASADLRLCRAGPMFTLLKRTAGSAGPWEVAATIERPDLPDSLQVGPNLYSDSQPDMTARYSNLVLEAPPSGAACDS